MTWSLYGERLDTADLSGTPRVYQPISFSKNRNLKCLKVWVIFFNTPVFTSLKIDIWSDRDGAPATKIISTTKSWNPADISSLPYAAKELWFDFDNPFSIRKGTTYHIALSASGYTGDSTSHLAWVRGYPDPNSIIDIVANTANISRIPFYLGAIDDLR